MPNEIERKFLVINDDWKKGATGIIFQQAYLNSDAERTVRVRIAADKAFLTIKSKTINISRQEFEYEIPTNEAQQLLSLCETEALEKYRYTVQVDGSTWEIDEFLGSNKGLIIAEIELEYETQSFTKPNWLGDEVSNDKRYFNSLLTIHPYSSWDN